MNVYTTLLFIRPLSISYVLVADILFSYCRVRTSFGVQLRYDVNLNV